ncbi:hypothetical protein F8S13_16145 [Chloroflexia bacterium SDU3-3]|nr:hypothetical protein F8S13_16145 [Chloroflexia bacterium SDU3-3]
MGRPARSADFFRVWTPAMAYVLGYWWTDGCMRIKSDTGAHMIEIASNDRDHLELLAEAIGGNYHLRKVAITSNTYVISFCSKEMYQDILAHGGTPRKSRTIGFPELPDEFLSHFVRGVIDGDGSLVWNGDRPVIYIYSASSVFLEQLGIAVEKLTGIPSPNLTPNRNNHYIKWSTTRAKCLAAWLYEQHRGIALERKATIADAFLQWHPKKRPEQGTITDEMRRNFPDYLPK